jgi:hypothetical protein
MDARAPPPQDTIREDLSIIKQAEGHFVASYLRAGRRRFAEMIYK